VLVPLRLFLSGGIGKRHSSTGKRVFLFLRVFELVCLLAGFFLFGADFFYGFGWGCGCHGVSDPGAYG
jgi:hypothetical protein